MDRVSVEPWRRDVRCSEPAGLRELLWPKARTVLSCLAVEGLGVEADLLLIDRDVVSNARAELSDVCLVDREWLARPEGDSVDGEASGGALVRDGADD